MRPFTDVLAECTGGQTLETLTNDLAEVVAAVVATGKQGALTLKLDVKPNGANGVVIADKIATKVPRDRGTSLFFTDEDGGLHRRDPRQHDLPLRRVGEEDHDPQTGEVH